MPAQAENGPTSSMTASGRSSEPIVIDSDSDTQSDTSHRSKHQAIDEDLDDEMPAFTFERNVNARTPSQPGRRTQSSSSAIGSSSSRRPAAAAAFGTHRSPSTPSTSKIHPTHANKREVLVIGSGTEDGSASNTEDEEASSSGRRNPLVKSEVSHNVDDSDTDEEEDQMIRRAINASKREEEDRKTGIVKRDPGAASTSAAATAQPSSASMHAPSFKADPGASTSAAALKADTEGSVDSKVLVDRSNTAGSSSKPVAPALHSTSSASSRAAAALDGLPSMPGAFNADPWVDPSTAAATDPSALDVMPTGPLNDDGTVSTDPALANRMADMLNAAGSNLQGVPELMGQIFEQDEEAIAEMASLKPCSDSFIAKLHEAGLRTRLKAHQSSGLKFLVDCEHRKPPMTKEDGQICLWSARQTLRGDTCWVNPMLEGASRAAPRMPKGAILADAMGLGKTLTVLSLILSPASGKGVDDEDSGAESSSDPISAKKEQYSDDDKTRAPGKGSKPRKKQKKFKRSSSESDSDMDIFIVPDDHEETDEEDGRWRRRKEPGGKSKSPSEPRKRPSLIICPLSVLSNWVDQAKAHTDTRKVKFGVLHGAEAKPILAKRDWSKYDFLVTTYDTAKNAYRDLALLNYNRAREARFDEEVEEIENKIKVCQQELKKDPTHAGFLASLEQSKLGLKNMKADHDEQRLITPVKGGETDYRKQAQCQARAEKIGCKAKPSVSSRGYKALEDSDDNFEEELSDASAEQNYSEDDLIYVWSGHNRNRKNDRLFEEDWLRVVLDEAHQVRNAKTLAYDSIVQLQADRRIAVTGTPIVNNTKDLGSLAAWIGIEPFAGEPNQQLWAQAIQKPLEKRERRGINLLRSITKSLVCLRTKEMKVNGQPLVDLPPLQIYKYEVELKEADRAFYDQAEEALRGRLIRMADDGELTQSSTCILVFLARMRQLSNERRLVPEDLIELIQSADYGAAVDSSTAEDGSMNMTPVQVEDLRTILEAAIENQENCPICYEALTREEDPVITYCKHFFHNHCIQLCLEQSQRCPMDRRTLRKNTKLVRLPEPAEEADEPEEAEAEATGIESAKIQALLRILETIYAASPTDKVVVFSNFVGLLKLISLKLKTENIAHTTFYGSHNKKRRDATLTSFARPLPVPSTSSAVVAGSSSAASNNGGRGSLNDQLDLFDFHFAASSSASKDKGKGKAKGKGKESLEEQGLGRTVPRVILMSIGAGSVGLNLTSANHVILTDPWYQTALESQAYSRCHRMGQTKPVMVYRLISKKTVEERVVQIAENKSELTKYAFEGVKYKGAAIYNNQASTEARLRDLGNLFGMSAQEVARITAATRRHQQQYNWFSR